VADFDHVPELAPPPAAPAAPSIFVEALLTGLEEVDARELDQRLCRAAALERGRLARIGPLLLAFANLRGSWQLGFRSLDAYARERLGMSPRKARALLALERACALAPVIGDAWREGRITGSQVHTLVPIALAPGSEPWHAAWIERAAEVTVRRLEDDVEPRAHHVFARDGWRCTIPGCTSQRNLQLHHVLFRSAGGSEDGQNLTTLCAAHHQRCVRGGVIRISGRAPDALVFEMPLGCFRSGDRAVKA
jgi:hypothetical protein